MFKILYDNSNPFEGIAPTPLVSRSVSSVFYGKKHGEVESFTLNGVITGNHCPQDNELSFFWNKANQLLSNFSEPFKSFKIVEGGANSSGVLFSNGYSMVRSIDFEDSVYAGTLPFSISIDVFKEGSFQNYGIMEPSQKVSFEQSQNGDVSISKSTSAVGFNTSSNALENAKEFVQSITGISSIVSPAFISTAGMGNAILVSVQEKINRFTGTYQVDEAWLYNNAGNSLTHSVCEKTVTIESGEDGYRVSINGKIRGGIGQSFTSLRSDYNSIDFYGTAEEEYSKEATGELYVQPRSKQISENEQDKSISFSFVYSDTIVEDPYLIDSISVSWDAENNKSCVQASVEIKSLDFCPQSRWTKVKAFSDSFVILDWMKTRLTNLGYNLTLPNAITSSSISFDEQRGSISVSASVCEKKITIPSHFQDINYVVSISPAMPSFVPYQSIDSNEKVTVQKLEGLKRKTLSIAGSAVILNCSTYAQAETSLLAYINGLRSTYLSGGSDSFLTQHNIQRGEGPSRNKLSFSFSWNQNSSQIFTDGNMHSSLS